MTIIQDVIKLFYISRVLLGSTYCWAPRVSPRAVTGVTGCLLVRGSLREPRPSRGWKNRTCLDPPVNVITPPPAEEVGGGPTETEETTTIQAQR